MPPNDPHSTTWIIPTIAGMGVATLRRFRRGQRERWLVTLIRFIAHISSCLLAGYVVGGVLWWANYPKLIPPLCAVFGLYGSIIIDYLEDNALPLATEWFRATVKRSNPIYPKNPYEQTHTNDSNKHRSPANHDEDWDK